MKKKDNRPRPLGDIISDIETILDEMLIGHDMQHGDVLGVVHTFMMSHFPNQREEYVDGGNPVMYYGPIESLEKMGVKNEHAKSDGIVKKNRSKKSRAKISR